MKKAFYLGLRTKSELKHEQIRLHYVDIVTLQCWGCRSDIRTKLQAPVN